MSYCFSSQSTKRHSFFCSLMHLSSVHLQRSTSFLLCRSMSSSADFIQTTWVLSLSVRVNDFLRMRVTDFRGSEESTSSDCLASLIVFFSVLFLTATSSLFVSAWISILMVKFDFSNSLISAILKNTHTTSFDLEKILNWLLRKSASRGIRLEKNMYVSDSSFQLIISLFLCSFMKGYLKRWYVKIIQRNIIDRRRSHDFFINSQRGLDNNFETVVYIVLFLFFLLLFYIVKRHFFYLKWQLWYLFFNIKIWSTNERILRRMNTRILRRGNTTRCGDASTRKG